MNVFDVIYRGNLWNGIESRSGPGSGPAATVRLAGDLRALVAELGITSVLDVGCGDGYWMPELPGYVGFDASTEAIKHARALHPDRVYTADYPTGRFDLVILRDVIQHLSFTDGEAILSRAVSSSYGRYLLASTYIGTPNVDIVSGDCYSPDLTAPPFNMPQPLRLIFDGYTYHDADAIRDPSKHLGLWRAR